MPDPETNIMVLGEMRGQMREVVHSLNNLSMKFDGLAREVIALAVLAQDIGVLKVKIELLEAERYRNDGARGFGLALLKSPAIGWLVGAAISAWAILTGKVRF